MLQLTVYGVGYYIVPSDLPAWLFHRLRFLVLKFGENLDLAPKWARHNAALLVKKYKRIGSF